VGVQRAQRAVEDLAIDAHHVLASVVARGVRVVGVEQAHQLGAGHSHLPLQAHHPVQKANGEAVLAEVAPVAAIRSPAGEPADRVGAQGARRLGSDHLPYGRVGRDRTHKRKLSAGACALLALGLPRQFDCDGVGDRRCGSAVQGSASTRAAQGRLVVGGGCWQRG
jgi:hypothetical protein